MRFGNTKQEPRDLVATLQQILAVSETPAIRAARDHAEELAARLGAARRELTAAEDALGSAEAQAGADLGEGRLPPEDWARRARQRLEDARGEVRILEIAASRSRTVAGQLEAEERGHRLADCRAAQAEALQALDRALAAAAPANAVLVAVEAEAARILGSGAGFQTLAMPLLTRQDGGRSGYDHWRAWIESNGISLPPAPELATTERAALPAGPDPSAILQRDAEQRAEFLTGAEQLPEPSPAVAAALGETPRERRPGGRERRAQ